MNSLRMCRICGLEAYLQQDLDFFIKNKHSRYQRGNLCKECDRASRRKGGKYYHLNQRWNKLSNPKKIFFKGKLILFKENPRTNVCSECGRKYPEDLNRQTALHHDFYDESNPLKNTRELCQGCHVALHNNLRKETIFAKYRKKWRLAAPLEFQ